MTIKENFWKKSLIVIERFNVYNDKYGALKLLIDYVVEDLIFQELYKQNDVDLDYFEKHALPNTA